MGLRLRFVGGGHLFLDYWLNCSCCAPVSSSPSNDSGSEVSIVRVGLVCDNFRCPVARGRSFDIVPKQKGRQGVAFPVLS